MISNGPSSSTGGVMTAGVGTSSTASVNTTTTSAGTSSSHHHASSSSSSGLSSYSPISTLERQWGNFSSSSSPSQQRVCLFVRANPSSFLPGGVEQLLKATANSSRGGTPAPSTASTVVAVGEDEMTAATTASSSTAAAATTPLQPSSDDPFSFLNDNNTGQQQAPGTASVVPQQSRQASSSSGGIGFGKFLQKVAKSASHSLERGIHTLAIKADQGRNRDLLVVALYTSQGNLLSMTESQPLPEISTTIDGSTSTTATGRLPVPFVIPLLVPSTAEDDDMLVIKLWIQSGASLLQSTKSAKHYLLGSAYVRVSQMRQSLYNTNSSAKSNWMLSMELQLQSSILECHNGTLTICVTNDLKFPPLCGTGWSLSDPSIHLNPNNAANTMRLSCHPLYNLPLDQSYGFWLAGSGNNDSNLLLATERSIESTVVLPIAAAVAQASSTACQTSLLRAQQTLIQLRNRQLQQTTVSQQDPSTALDLEGDYYDCTIQVQSVQLTTNNSGTADTSSSPSAVSVSMAWQRPDTIFEVDLLSSSKALPIPVVTNNGTANPPISSTSGVTARFAAQPCPHHKVLPSLLQGMPQQQLQGRVFLGMVRLQLASASTISANTATNGGGGAVGVVPQNPFDPISNVSLRESLYHDTTMEVVGDCFLALDSFLGQPGNSAPPAFRQCPLFDSTGRTNIGSVTVSVSLQPRRGSIQQPPQLALSSIRANGLVSIMGLPQLCLSIQPYIDFEAPITTTVWSDPNAQRQHLQLLTMGDFMTSAYLQHHIATFREMDAQVLQERATAYQQALSMNPNTSEPVLLPPHHDKSPRPFRPSSSRSTLLLSGIPFNVHTASLSVRTTPISRPQSQSQLMISDEPIGEALYNTTCGAPADHARDFGNVFAVVKKTGGENLANTISNYTIASPIGPVSGGLRRLEAKRMELATCVTNLQSQLVENVGQYFVAQRQAGRSVTHVPFTYTSAKTLKSKLIEAVQALHHVTWICAVRRAAVFSQALGIAVTTFLGSMSDATNVGSSLPSVWGQHGYLISFEGLLSAAGKELGMIEDASVGIAMLRMVQVVFVRDDNGPQSSSASHVPIPSSPYLKWLDLQSTIGGPSGSRQFTLHIGITPSYYDQRIPVVLRNNVPVRFYPILFEVGVDIRQWGANAGSSVLTQFEEQRSLLFSGDKSSNSDPTLDDQTPQEVRGGGLIDEEDDDIGVTDDDVLVQMNYEGFQLLNTYAYSTSPPAQLGQPQAQQRIHPFLEKLYQHIVSSAGKMDHNILDEAATLARRLGGGGAVFCKSGKDRTAMHVTFKQAQFIGRYRESLLRPGQSNPFATLADGTTPATPSSSDTSPLEDAKLLRIYGTRLPICEKNVGQAKYAFNSLQVKFMPEALKPPMNTLAGFLKGGKVFTGGIES